MEMQKAGWRKWLLLLNPIFHPSWILIQNLFNDGTNSSSVFACLQFFLILCSSFCFIHSRYIIFWNFGIALINMRSIFCNFLAISGILIRCARFVLLVCCYLPRITSKVHLAEFSITCIYFIISFRDIVFVILIQRKVSTSSVILKLLK